LIKSRQPQRERDRRQSHHREDVEPRGHAAY
jgi:hypothetical protein